MNLEDRARKFTRTHGRYSCEVNLKCLTDFAQQVADEAVKAREKQIADELERMPIGRGTDTQLTAYIAQLRNGETK